jgi:hypothetical protein
MNIYSEEYTSKYGSLVQLGIEYIQGFSTFADEFVSEYNLRKAEIDTYGFSNQWIEWQKQNAANIINLYNELNNSNLIPENTFLTINTNTMVTVQLKAKEFLLIAYTLLNEPSNSTFGLLTRIKNATASQNDDTVVSVEASEAEVEMVYRKLTNAPEGIFNAYNDSMFNQLSSQIQAGAANDDQAWVSIGNKLSVIRAENLGRADQFIAFAKTKFA